MLTIDKLKHDFPEYNMITEVVVSEKIEEAIDSSAAEVINKIIDSITTDQMIINFIGINKYDETFFLNFINKLISNLGIDKFNLNVRIINLTKEGYLIYTKVYTSIVSQITKDW